MWVQQLGGLYPVKWLRESGRVLFFCSFTLIVSYVMLNLTVAVVLEGFASSQQEDDDDDAIFVPELLEEFQ